MTRTLLAVAAFIAATASYAILQKAAAQDVEKGQRSFNKCLPCHAIGPGAENKVGPELNGLDGRQAGTAANFNYSDANKNSGIVWNVQGLYPQSASQDPRHEDGIRRHYQSAGD